MVREMEHVARGKARLSVGVERYLVARKETVATNYLLILGVPDDKLLIGIGADVEVVKVESLASAATCGAEGYLTQAANLLKHVGRVLPRNDVYLVVALVGAAQLSLGSQLGFEHLLVDRRDNGFHIIEH